MSVEIEKIITIVTVTYNAEIIVEKTIKSIVKQLKDNVEYMVVDGASKDETLKIVNKYRDYMSTIISESDNGIYDAMNKAIKIAKGKYIIFVNAGDILCDNVLSQILFSLQNSNTDMLYGNVICKYIDKDKIYAGKFNNFKIVKQNICQQAIFYKKDKLVEFGLFDTKYKIYADWIMNMKFFCNSCKNVYLDLCICEYDMYGISNRFTDNEFFANIKKIIYENFSLSVYVYYLIRVCLIKKMKMIYRYTVGEKQIEE